jgi:hypothetical protein
MEVLIGREKKERESRAGTRQQRETASQRPTSAPTQREAERERRLQPGSHNLANTALQASSLNTFCSAEITRSILSSIMLGPKREIIVSRLTPRPFALRPLLLWQL